MSGTVAIDNHVGLLSAYLFVMQMYFLIALLLRSLLSLKLSSKLSLMPRLRLQKRLYLSTL